jgi:hypothetical protein
MSNNESDRLPDILKDALSEMRNILEEIQQEIALLKDRVGQLEKTNQGNSQE